MRSEIEELQKQLKISKDSVEYYRKQYEDLQKSSATNFSRIFELENDMRTLLKSNDSIEFLKNEINYLKA